MWSLLRLLLPLALVTGLAAPAAAQVSLPGSWYVLIHYKDDASPNPEQERWDDKVWEFAQKGKRLRWTEYPIVVFDDETGRFERRSTGQYARILHYWEPDAGQLADVADGLQVNQRGAKKKTLRGSDARGWSSGRSSSAASASVVTYVEVWRIEGMPGLPVFSREDHLGGGRTDSMEGLTQYSATEVLEDGNLIVGTFVRDGTRHGTFKMMRAGKAGALKSQKTQAEIQRQGAVRGAQSNSEARAAAREALGAELKRSGVSLPESDLDAITNEIIAAYVAGVPQDQIEKRVRSSVEERYVAYIRTDQGGALLRDRLRSDFESEGLSLSDEQLDAAQKATEEAIADGADAAEIRRRVAKALGVPAR